MTHKHIYCVNSGFTQDDKPNFISHSLANGKVLFNVGADGGLYDALKISDIYGNNKIYHKINEIEGLDTGFYHILLNTHTGLAYTTTCNIFEDNIAPSDPNEGDLWLDTQVCPFKCKIFQNGLWIKSEPWVKLGFVNAKNGFGSIVQYSYNGESKSDLYNIEKGQEIIFPNYLGLDTDNFESQWSAICMSSDCGYLKDEDVNIASFHNEQNASAFSESKRLNLSIISCIAEPLYVLSKSGKYEQINLEKWRLQNYSKSIF